MAITKMNKFTLICLRENKKSVLKNLQSFGNSQLINLQSETNKENLSLKLIGSEGLDDDIKSIDTNLTILKSSISFLNAYVPKVSGLKAMKEGKPEINYDELQKFVDSSNWDIVCEELKSKEHRISDINNEKNKIKAELDLLKPWTDLDVSFNELSNFKNAKAYTGVIKVSSDSQINEIEEKFNELPLSNLYIVNRLNNDVYILLLVHESEKKDVETYIKSLDFSEVKISTSEKPSITIKNLEGKISELEEQKSLIVDSLKSDDRLSLLEKCEEYFDNARDRLECSKNFIGSKNTVVISGWVPVELNDELSSSIKDATLDYYLVFEDVKEEEDLEVPVKLKNNKFVSAFESITEMYSLPNYKGLDPTPWLAPFYLVYFGMMVADIGYGILVTLAALLSLKMFKFEENSEKFAKLFAYLGISTTIWGFIYGAGFGDFISFKSLLSQSDDIFTIMYLSIGFGVFQILVGMLIKLYMLLKSKQYYAAFAEVGFWLITFAGIALAVLKIPFGTIIMIVGMIAIVLTNGGDATSVAGKLGNGTYALYNITGYLGDLISYTRLMALGIAGGSIAGAMNLIIGNLPGVAALVIGPILFVLLHVFNLLLGLLGAYVHSCRLQYVEYFGKFYDGGGEAFKPFKMKNKKLKVK